MSESPANKVFVVHGRNIKAKEQIFIFLRALGLEPIEWEQAVSLTGMAAPHTLDIVKAGLEVAQCVVVLLTGDEIVKLRPAYGVEPYRLQPRPNVLLEAGWALGVAGQQRTILVCFEEIRRISDIDGLNYILLSNNSDSKNAFVSRLKNAGCDVHEEGRSDYLSAERGGNFDTSYISPVDEVDGFDRGRFTEVLADSALSFALSNINLNKNLSTDLRRGGTIELKYHYLGVTCAKHWLALCQNYDYGHKELIESIATHFDEVIDICNFGSSSVDLISLGSGDGQIDVRLLSKLTRSIPNFEYYYCIDISFELLQQAVAHIVECSDKQYFGKRFRIKAIHGDFIELRRLAPIYTFDDSVNFFTLNGNTLGNHNEADLLQAIREGMETNDLLFLDVRLHKLDSWDGCRAITEEEKQIVMSGYSNPLNTRFAFGPLERATSLSYEDIKFDYDINQMITCVPNSLNLIIYCNDLNAKILSSNQSVRWKRLNLAATTLYSYSSLVQWLPTRGFHLIWHKAHKNIGLFLLRKI
ncbi:MAG: L-histidine N(alpha)-methyltransferase [Pyrinomonadaceae bacterium]